MAAVGEDFASADYIIAVKRAEHWPAMDAQFPQWRDQVEYWHVDDLDCATAEQALPQLEALIAQLIERLAADSLAEAG
jgi:protein-tyrosine-phosphatase